MIVWTVSNQKGGVGKTTSSVALAGLALEAGKRVLLVDLDPHGSLTSYFKHDPDTLQASVFTLFAERKQLAKQLVDRVTLKTDHEGLNLIPASGALATLERQAVGDGMGLVLARTLTQVYDEYDVAIIDCPPQLGVLMVNALAACSLLIIPVQTEFLAIKGLDRILHTLGMLAKSRHRELEYLIVPTMFDRRTQASVGSLRTIRNSYSDHTWAGKIPVDTKLRDASKAGVLPHKFDPAGRAVEAYTSLYAHLMERAVRMPSANTAVGG